MNHKFLYTLLLTIGFVGPTIACIPMEADRDCPSRLHKAPCAGCSEFGWQTYGKLTYQPLTLLKLRPAMLELAAAHQHPQALLKWNEKSSKLPSLHHAIKVLNRFPDDWDLHASSYAKRKEKAKQAAKLPVSTSYISSPKPAEKLPVTNSNISSQQFKDDFAPRDISLTEENSRLREELNRLKLNAENDRLKQEIAALKNQQLHTFTSQPYINASSTLHADPIIIEVTEDPVLVPEMPKTNKPNQSPHYDNAEQVDVAKPCVVTENKCDGRHPIPCKGCATYCWKEYSTIVTKYKGDKKEKTGYLELAAVHQHAEAIKKWRKNFNDNPTEHDAWQMIRREYTDRERAKDRHNPYYGHTKPNNANNPLLKEMKKEAMHELKSDVKEGFQSAFESYGGDGGFGGGF